MISPNIKNKQELTGWLIALLLIALAVLFFRIGFEIGAYLHG